MKINTVVQRGVNDDEIVDLATFGRERGVEVRFIEFMPLDASGGWADGAVVGQDEIVGRIAAGVPASSSCRHVARRRPTAGATSTAAAPSASSRASPSRSAATATASA